MLVVINPGKECETYEHVLSAHTEDQGPNGYWLFIYFKKGSIEYDSFSYGECAIEIDPKDEIHFLEDSL